MATASKSAPSYTPPSGTVNVGTASAPILQNISGTNTSTNSGLAVGQSRTDTSGGVTTNVTGQAPQVLGNNNTPIPGAPKLDANGNIIPGTGSATTANSTTATNIATPPATTPPVAPLNTTTAIPSTSATAPLGATPAATSTPDAATAAKYQAAHAGLTAGGSAAPVNPGDGAAAAANAVKNSTVAQPQDNSNVQQALQNDPGYQQLLKDQADYNSTVNQSQTLEQHYQQLQNEYDIPALNTQLMNMKNVIDGTETDIRNEVQAASGFATNSQVLALSDARNKTIIQNYNNLQAAVTNAQNQVNTMIGLAKEDKAFALSVITGKIGIDEQLASYADKFISNAKEGYNNIINSVGYSGFYNGLINSDPTGKTLTDAAKLMGVTPIELKTAAAQDAKVRNLDIQQKQASINASNSTVRKNNFDMSGGGPATIDPTTGVPQGLTPYLNTASNGTKYIDASTLQGTAKQKTALINQASAAGLKVITNKNTAADLINIQDAKSKLDTINTIMAGIGQPNALSRTLGGLGLTKLATTFQTDPQKAAAGALQSVGLDILKAISGVQGFRGNATAVQQVTDHLPNITDTVATINKKVEYINALMTDREDAALGTTGQSSGDQTVNGVTYSKGADGLYYPKQ